MLWWQRQYFSIRKGHAVTAEFSTLEPIESTGPESLRRSPGGHLAGAFAAAEVQGPRGVALREVPFLTMIGLRASLASPAARRLEEVLGFSLPQRSGEVTGIPGRSVLWLSPDEFLVVTSEDSGEHLRALQEALRGESGSVLDLSANRTTFELTGPSARSVLEKGCPLDLHPRSLAENTALNTNIGRVAVILWKTGAQTYQIFPRSSFADYLGRWLVDAMSEFKAAEIL